jgi:hypothetical protein
LLVQNTILLKKGTKIFLNYIIGPIIFIWLITTIYHQVTNQKDFNNSWQQILQSIYGPQAWKFYLVIFLMLFNWGFEARKWQLLIKPIETVSFFTAFKAVLSGLALSLNIPNRLGEYIGRMAFMHEGNRLRSIALTIVGSISQVIITMVIGILGLIYMRFYILDETHKLEGLSILWLNGLLYALSSTTIIIILIYYRISFLIQIVEKIPFFNKYIFFVKNLEEFHWKELTNILFLSGLRYLVFVMQYLLLLQVFNVNIETLNAISAISVLFLVLAIIPTIPIAELGVRGEAGIQLFGLLSVNKIGIIATAAGIWVINLIIPALAGSLFILSIKLFRNK